MVRTLQRRLSRRVAAAAGVVAVVAVGAWVWRERTSVEAGARLLGRGDPAAAVRALAPVVARAPRDARARYYLGIAYARLGERDGAINQLEEAVRLTPSDARFHARLGQAYRDDGDARRALDELELAIQADRQEPRYEVQLGSLLLETGRIDDALRHLRRAVRLAPNRPEVHLALAEGLRVAGDRAGMIEEYRATQHLADDGVLGEVAREARGAVERMTASGS